VTIFGVDIHPGFQAGISIEQIHREGFDFLIAKLSEGLGDGYIAMGSRDWIRRGKAAGMVCAGYHYLRPGNIREQARIFAAGLNLCDVPGMIDAEALAADDKTPTLTIQAIREFYVTATAYGARIPLLYLPKWYWQRIGSPPLAGLPVLVSSSYPSNRKAIATDLYAAVTPSRWVSYGGNPVGVLQFAQSALVAGRAIDVNAYLGTRDSFASLLGAPVPLIARTTPEADMAYPIPPTPIPEGAKPEDVPIGGWPAVEHTIATPGLVGGWRGRIIMRAGFGYRGAFVEEAWSAPSGKHYVDRYDSKAKTGGRYVSAFDTQKWELPAGDDLLVVRLATRAYGSVTPEVEH
jgi:hypothetical protein